ncbi:SEC10/PgrA surface exclusion domain-containing protein [Limosilactobacillus oris]|uniref:SEC10/PgrA surface exclusion domain-containing protein n=2 Tax=Limosilactobacillus oris TaxID=1632 RepID=UPI0024B3A252|nr:SEC10/PgrA surface exclusion domain-containing protein [Limosilactobacillus oris]WHO85846.1 SEC10/PgrA surface exclusion domain-containing protein [Limosilactobacillus oris]
MQNKIDYYANTRAMPTFTFTPEQTAATQRFINDVAPIMRSGNFNSNDFYRLSSFAAWQAAMTTRQGLNWQDQNGDDQKIILDLDHLTADQVNILSKFTAAILNQVRQQLGIAGTVGTAVATSGMGDVAQEVATLYGERTDTAAHHYIYALKKAAFDHSMTNQYATAADMVTWGSNSLGESLLTDGNANYTNRMTMAQAKNAIASHNSASERAKQAQSGLTHVLDEYDDIADPAALEQALDDIAVARGEYYRAQTAQANAQKALSTAQATLQTATSDYQAAQEKLNQMPADQGISLSDAQKYSNLVMITPITVTAGQSTSAPQIANGFINPVNSQAAQIFAAFANEPGAEIPYGTTASWADASQLAVDTQRAGNYAEDVLISFPDGSTTTIQAALTVQPAAVTLTDSNEAANSLATAPASQGQGMATATPQAALLTAGSQQQGGGNASQRISRGNQHSSNRSLDYFNDGCHPERDYQSPYN